MSLELKDKIVTCQDCKNTFSFTAGEQEFYLKKAFSEPKRCPSCRKARKKIKRKKRKELLKSLNAEKEKAERLPADSEMIKELGNFFNVKA